MTTPIEPGPWSFLESAGKALGAYGDLRHQRAVERIARDRQTIMDAIMMRQQFQDPNATNAPGVAEAARRLGLQLPTRTTASEQQNELVSGILDRYSMPDIQVDFPTLGAPEVNTHLAVPRVNDEERRIAGLPSQASLAVERNQLRQATSQAPLVAGTAVAGQETERQPAIDAATDEVVLSWWADNGQRLPTTAQAFELGQRNARVQRLGNVITKDSYARAIRRISDMDEQRRIQLAAPLNRGVGTQDDLLGRITAQINAIQVQRDELVNTIPGMVSSVSLMRLRNPNLSHEERAQIMNDPTIRQIYEFDNQIATLKSQFNTEWARLRPGQRPPQTGSTGATSAHAPTGTTPTPAPASGIDHNAEVVAEYRRQVLGNPRKFGTSQVSSPSQVGQRRKLMNDIRRLRNLPPLPASQ